MYVKRQHTQEENSCGAPRPRPNRPGKPSSRPSIEVFLERGVTRATLDEIARAAGVTRGAIYWHFRDKLEIFLALERRENLPNKEFGERLKARLAADPGLDPVEELAESIKEGLHSFEANLERCSILTILWLTCEYVDEMRPVLKRQQGADAALRELFETVISFAAARSSVASIWPPNIAARALFLRSTGRLRTGCASTEKASSSP